MNQPQPPSSPRAGGNRSHSEEASVAASLCHRPTPVFITTTSTTTALLCQPEPAPPTVATWLDQDEKCSIAAADCKLGRETPSPHPSPRALLIHSVPSPQPRFHCPPATSITTALPTYIATPLLHPEPMQKPCRCCRAAVLPSARQRLSCDGEGFGRGHRFDESYYHECRSY